MMDIRSALLNCRESGGLGIMKSPVEKCYFKYNLRSWCRVTKTGITSGLKRPPFDYDDLISDQWIVVPRHHQWPESKLTK